MNLAARLIHLAHVSGVDRMLGRTTLIAKAAKELGGMVIAHNHAHAQQIERQHGVPARSMDINLFGFNGPFFFDHYAIEKILLRAAHKIHDLEQEIAKHDEQRRRDAASMEKLALEIGRLQKLNAGLEEAIGKIRTARIKAKQEGAGK